MGYAGDPFYSPNMNYYPTLKRLAIFGEDGTRTNWEHLDEI
jgi:hypothetical protein